MKKLFVVGERTLVVELERLGGGRYRVRLDGRAVELSAVLAGEGRVRVELGGRREELALTRADRELFASSPARDLRVRIESAHRRTGHDHHGHGEISLPMPGRVVKLHVREGDAVKKGQALLVVEAMKMEHTLKAPRDGSVSRLAAREGEMVEAGVAIVEFE